MTQSFRHGRAVPGFLRIVFVSLIAILFALAPFCLAAQTPDAAQSSTPSVATAQSANGAQPANGSAAEQNSNSDDMEQGFLHSPTVQSVARILHLKLETTVLILLVINFAVIFLALVVPLSRAMPKIIRKRSQTLSHDLSTARAATADAKARLSAVEAQLAGLGDEIARFRTEMENDAREDEKRIKASLSEESARIVAAAEQEIGAALAQAKRGLRNFAADLAIDHASRQMTLTPETDHALIAEFISGVSGDGSGQGGRS